MKDKGSRVKKRSLELADPRKEFIRETRETEMIKLTKKVNERYEFFEEVARKIEVLRTTEKIASFFSLSLLLLFNSLLALPRKYSLLLGSRGG